MTSPTLHDTPDSNIYNVQPLLTDQSLTHFLHYRIQQTILSL